MTFLNSVPADQVSHDQLCLHLFRTLDKRRKTFRKLRRKSWKTPAPLLVDEFDAATRRLLVCLALFEKIFPQANASSVRQTVGTYGGWFAGLNQVYALKELWLARLEQFPHIEPFEDVLAEMEYKLLSRYPKKFSRDDKKLLRKTIRLQFTHLNQLRKERQDQGRIDEVIDILQSSLIASFQRLSALSSNLDTTKLSEAYEDFLIFHNTLEIVVPLWPAIEFEWVLDTERMTYELESLKDLKLLLDHLNAAKLTDKTIYDALDIEIAQRLEVFLQDVQKLSVYFTSIFSKQ